MTVSIYLGPRDQAYIGHGSFACMQMRHLLCDETLPSSGEQRLCAEETQHWMSLLTRLYRWRDYISVVMRHHFVHAMRLKKGNEIRNYN